MPDMSNIQWQPFRNIIGIAQYPNTKLQKKILNKICFYYIYIYIYMFIGGGGGGGGGGPES